MTSPFDRASIDDNHRLLMQVSATMFDIPCKACLVRSCRRNRACCRLAPDTNRPVCLEGLGPEYRLAFERFFEILFAIHDGSYPQHPSKDPARLWLESEAIRIIRAALPHLPDKADRITGWLARYHAPQAVAPPLDTSAMLEAMRVELRANAIRDQLLGI